MKIGLYLMTEKAVPVMHAALQSGLEISHITVADATGMNDQSRGEIEATSKAAQIPTFLRAHPPEFTGNWSIAAGWRWMLDVPNLVVIHDSLLPRYRGFSPLITALVNGETQMGATAFLARDDPDTGPIIAQRTIPISYPVRVAQVIESLKPIYHDLALEVLRSLASEGIVRYAEQDHSSATYSLFRDELDYKIDWSRDDRRICRLVDAVSDPFPGAWSYLDGAVARIHSVAIEPDVRIEDRQPGKVAFIRDGCYVVTCGVGLVRITELESIFPGMAQKLRFS